MRSSRSGEVAVRAPAVAEDVAVAFGGAGACCQRGLEPLVLVRGVVGDDVHDDLDAGLMRGAGELVEVVHGAELRVDVAVVVHIVAAVGELGRVEGAQPDGIHAQLLQVGDLLGHAGDIAEAGTGSVLEGTRVDLIDHGLLPPQGRIGRVRDSLIGACHRRLLSMLRRMLMTTLTFAL